MGGHRDDPPDAKTGAHHHGHLESIIYVVKGKARMRWGEHLQFTAEAGPGDFIFVPPYVPHQEINASRDEGAECVLVRSDGEAVAINLDIEPVEKPETVLWVDPVPPRSRREEVTRQTPPPRGAAGNPMKLVRYESAGHVATITMDRRPRTTRSTTPCVMNCARPGCRFHDSDDRVAVLASAEEKVFSVGADVRDLPRQHVARGAWTGSRTRQAGHCRDIRMGRRRGLRAGADGRHVRGVRDDALHLPRGARSAPPPAASPR
jgi:uncharacterized RmlC-like cupin family protein